VNKLSTPSVERRSFLGGLSSRIAALGALGAGSAIAKGKAPVRWEPARHEKDDWLDKPAVKHRLVFDATTKDGFSEALAFAGNYLRVNQSDYGLHDSDVAVVIVARHRATQFAYNNAMWAKYGASLAASGESADAKAKEPPTVNVFNSAPAGGKAPSDEKAPDRGPQIDALAKRGVQFAVCALATRRLAGIIAKKVNAKADDINSELVANLLGSNSVMVPAGIVGVSRAQERGYTLVKA